MSEHERSRKAGEVSVGSLNLDWRGIQTQAIGGVLAAAIIGISRYVFRAMPISKYLLILAAAAMGIVLLIQGRRSFRNSAVSMRLNIAVDRGQLILRQVLHQIRGIWTAAHSITVIMEIEGADFPLRLKDGSSIIFGRKPDLGVYAVEDRFMSARHACLRYIDGRATIEDLDSRNCTYVNGRRLRPRVERELKPGDKIKMGATIVRMGS